MAGTLRDIKFKSFSAQILSIKFPRVLVEWELEKTTQNLSNFKFFVDRGESPENLKTISSSAGIPANTLDQFLDLTPHLHDLSKVLYYRVRGVEFFNGTAVQTFETKHFTWDGESDFVALYIIDEHMFLHRCVAGSPVLIYKKKKEGIKDVGPQGTFDPVLKRNVTSNSTRNKGTPYVGGYYDPIPEWMDLAPDPKTAQIPEWGERQDRQTDIQFTNFPLLAPGDLILEVKPHRLYKVENVRNTHKNRTIMLQVARINEIQRSDIEYTVPIPQDMVDGLLAELQERINTPEF